jgi:hypothetical protein
VSHCAGKKAYMALHFHQVGSGISIEQKNLCLAPSEILPLSVHTAIAISLCLPFFFFSTSHSPKSSVAALSSSPVGPETDMEEADKKN